MEEILASIRSMISEDGGGGISPSKSVKEKSATEMEMRNLADTAQKAPAADKHGTPFELTQEIQEDGTVVDLKTGQTIHGITETRESLELKPDSEFPKKEDKLPNDSNVPLETGLGLATSLAALAATVENRQLSSGPSSDVRAIEELTREVMRPMIREWLDENLPSLVERLVGREIQNLTREAEEDYQS